MAYDFEHAIEITPGLTLLIDINKFEIKGGVTFAPGEFWSNEIIITLDAHMRDILEDNESKVEGVIILRKRL